MIRFSKRRWHQHDIITESIDERYLSRIKSVINKAVEHHHRVLAIRVDLRYPKGYRFDHEAITRFIASLKAKINHDCKIKNRRWNRNHNYRLRYIWCLEQDSSQTPHYHLLLLVNNDIYRGIGEYHNSNYLSGLISEAWSSALADPDVQAYFPKNHSYRLNINSEDYDEQFNDLFYRVSYLAKTRTKNRSRRYRSFGTSAY